MGLERDSATQRDKTRTPSIRIPSQAPASQSTGSPNLPLQFQPAAPPPSPDGPLPGRARSDPRQRTHTCHLETRPLWHHPPISSPNPASRIQPLTGLPPVSRFLLFLPSIPVSSHYPRFQPAVPSSFGDCSVCCQPWVGSLWGSMKPPKSPPINSTESLHWPRPRIHMPTHQAT